MQQFTVRVLFPIFTLLILASCSSLFGDKLELSKTSYTNLSGWSADNQQMAMRAFEKSCAKYNTMPANKSFHTANFSGKYSDWQAVCRRTGHYPTPQQFFENNFTPFSVRNWLQSKGLFTGYYESSLRGSRTRKFPYLYPVYKTPQDLVPGKKYYTRAEIDAGALAGKGLEILWVDSPVALFFMQVQGSGRVALDDGGEVRLAYDSKNGHKYVSIGRYLIAGKYLQKEQVSKATIEAWLRQNPDKLQTTLEKNPSYVFFRELTGDGPIGAQGVALTPRRSLAVDKKFIPYGAPVWLDAKVNGGEDRNSSQTFRKLLIAQDTGGAIKGPVRGDIFFGYGAEAEKMAGYQNNQGRYYILLPNSVVQND